MIYVPFLPTFLTDFCFSIAPLSLQYPHNPYCSKLELKLMDCFEAYGARKGMKKCQDLLYDMNECQTAIFQRLRAEEIRAERMRQYRSGKIDKPFDEYPPVDSYFYLY